MGEHRAMAWAVLGRGTRGWRLKPRLKALRATKAAWRPLLATAQPAEAGFVRRQAPQVAASAASPSPRKTAVMMSAARQRPASCRKAKNAARKRSGCSMCGECPQSGKTSSR